MAAANACPFERAIQTTLFSCSHSEKVFVGEKESIICTNLNARQECISIISQLKKNARFALQANTANGLLTHGQEMKLKCGGLQGLQQLSCNEASTNDVYSLISASMKEYGNLTQLPYPELVKAISRYKLRRNS